MAAWSPQQDDALRRVAEWQRSPDQQVFRLFGYAGTGKTTLAKHFAEGVDGTVLFGAFTGKAAYVLRTKGCPGATTIHSMIYHTKDKGQAHLKELESALAELRMQIRSEGPPDLKPEDIDKDPKVQELSKQIEAERNSLARPMFTLNMESTVKEAKLVVIDECSMVDGRMGEDLLSFGCKVLVLGDPAQLPPVGGAGFFTEHEPDVMLTEIHRQAATTPSSTWRPASACRRSSPWAAGGTASSPRSG
jgi:exodeoxyribonuclease-5